MSHRALLAAIREADVLLNSSLTEGMANVILEAMALRVPVLARRNEGNCSLVGSQQELGFLFTTPSECFRIIDSEWTRRQGMPHACWSVSARVAARISAAAQYIQAKHSCESEAALYKGILERAVAAAAGI